MRNREEGLFVWSYKGKDVNLDFLKFIVLLQMGFVIKYVLNKIMSGVWSLVMFQSQNKNKFIKQFINILIKGEL